MAIADKALRKQRRPPKRIVTDKLGSYAAAKRKLMPNLEHRSHNSPLTKSSSADSVLSSRHNGNQRWRWGDQRLFRMI